MMHARYVFLPMWLQVHVAIPSDHIPNSWFYDALDAAAGTLRRGDPLITAGHTADLVTAVRTSALVVRVEEEAELSAALRRGAQELAAKRDERLPHLVWIAVVKHIVSDISSCLFLFFLLSFFVCSFNACVYYCIFFYNMPTRNA
jgi:hypothetical protein